jgi:hypothetical protein
VQPGKHRADAIRQLEADAVIMSNGADLHISGALWIGHKPHRPAPLTSGSQKP